MTENSRRDDARNAVVASLRRFHAAGRQTSIDAQLAAGRDLAEVATDLLSELSNEDEPVAGAADDD